MEEQKRSGLEDAASIAHTVKGAIQTGKAIAGATKGAAVGGLYGAVAPVHYLWQSVRRRYRR